MNPFHALLSFLCVAALTGCSVLQDDGGSEPEPEPTASALTYYRDVLPVVYAKCMPCHTAGGAGGIAFDEVGTAQTWAGTMAYETAGDVMPPWPPDETKTDFVGEEARTLTASEKQVFTDWSNAGAPAGDPADAPAPPEPAPDLLGVPDIAASTTEYVFDDSAVADEIVCFHVDPGIVAPSDLIAADVTPGNEEIVHHVIVFRELASASEPAQEVGPCSGFGGNQMLFGWTPGSAPMQLPEGYGLQLDAGDHFVLQVHYHANTNGTSDTDPGTSADVWFSETPVATPVHVVALGSPLIDIPPMTSGVTVEATCDVTQSMGEVTIIGTAPHMHTHATKFSTRIESASGNDRILVDIPSWDFNWQGSYQPKTPEVLQPGDRLVTTCTYDNPSDFSITFGESTDDEMCFNFLLVAGNMPAICL